MRRSRECEGHKAAIQIDLRSAQVIQQDLAAASAAAELTVVVSQQYRSGSTAAVLALQLPAVGERLHTVDIAAGGKFFQCGQHDAYRLLFLRLFLRCFVYPQSEQQKGRRG